MGKGLEAVLAENKAAMRGQSQGSLFHIGSVTFKNVRNHLPDRRFGEHIRAALFLVDSLEQQTGYVAAEWGYPTRPYGRVVPIDSTMSQYPIVRGEPEYCADVRKTQKPFFEIGGEQHTLSFLGVPLRTE